MLHIQKYSHIGRRSLAGQEPRTAVSYRHRGCLSGTQCKLFSPTHHSDIKFCCTTGKKRQQLSTQIWGLICQQEHTLAEQGLVLLHIQTLLAEVSPILSWATTIQEKHVNNYLFCSPQNKTLLTLGLGNYFSPAAASGISRSWGDACGTARALSPCTNPTWKNAKTIRLLIGFF